jgi:hypothetical protein
MALSRFRMDATCGGPLVTVTVKAARGASMLRQSQGVGSVARQFDSGVQA